jgi:hypothetical protein
MNLYQPILQSHKKAFAAERKKPRPLKSGVRRKLNINQHRS